MAEEEQVLKLSKLSDAIKKNLNVALEDDDTPTGGISFTGETLKDFLYDVVMPTPEFLTIADVNKLLASCGIRPVKA